MLIRVSYGTLITLRGDGVLSKVAYLLQYSENGCLGNCAFCPQSRTSKSSRELLSRVVWPAQNLSDIIKLLRSSSVIKRVCLQTLITKDYPNDIYVLIKELNKCGKPLSLSITPVPKEFLLKVRNLGVDYLGIGLDSIDPNVFLKLRKPYGWAKYFDFINESVKVFGKDRVVTHVIIGLGEDIGTSIKVLKYIRELGSLISLFAFTPIKGTALESLTRPNLRYYRFMQVITHLLNRGLLNIGDYVVVKGCKFGFRKRIMGLLNDEVLVKSLIVNGCPYCNRPYYTESPKGPYYNYPRPEYIRANLSNEWKLIKGLIIE